MEPPPEIEGDSGYEASNEGGNETTSPSSEKSSIDPRVPDMPSHIVELRPSNQSQSEVVTKSRPYKDVIRRSLTSTSLETMQMQAPISRPQRNEPSSPLATSSQATSEMSNPQIPPRPFLRPGMTAREVAERAQDWMLTRNGSQQTPAQLLKKVIRVPDSEDEKKWIVTGSCFECQRRRVVPPLNILRFFDADPNTYPLLRSNARTSAQNCWPRKLRKTRLVSQQPNPRTHSPNQKPGHNKSTVQDSTDATERGLEVKRALSRRRGPPSKWQERRQKENSKLDIEYPLKEKAVCMPIERTMITKKKGRPVGWRKGLGVSYGELKRMSMKEREELIKKCDLK